MFAKIADDYEIAEFDEIMLLQSSIKTIIIFLASKGKFCK